MGPPKNLKSKAILNKQANKQTDRQTDRQTNKHWRHHKLQISSYTTKLQLSKLHGTGTNWNVDQWNRIEYLEINPQLSGLLTFDRGRKHIKWKKVKRYSLQQMVLETWTEIWKRTKLDHFLTKHMKINPKWIRDINAEPDTIKILEENTGSNCLTLAKETFSRYIS